jgi:glutamyl-tRNA reductase
MGRLAVKTLRAAGAGSVTIVNRSEERGRLLAEAFDATARPFDDLSDLLVEADIVITSTMSPQTVIDVEAAEGALARRPADSPLFIVDIAVPRDVEPAVGDLPGIILRDIEDLRTVVETNLGSRLGEVSKVEDIIAAEIEHFGAWERAIEATPTAAALVSKIDEIRRAEIERIKSQLDAMTPAQRDAVEHMSRRLVSKILHHPLKRSRELASEQDGKMYLMALRELFGLDDEG